MPSRRRVFFIPTAENIIVAFKKLFSIDKMLCNLMKITIEKQSRLGGEYGLVNDAVGN